MIADEAEDRGAPFVPLRFARAHFIRQQRLVFGLLLGRARLLALPPFGAPLVTTNALLQQSVKLFSVNRQLQPIDRRTRRQDVAFVRYGPRLVGDIARDQIGKTKVRLAEKVALLHGDVVAQQREMRHPVAPALALDLELAERLEAVLRPDVERLVAFPLLDSRVERAHGGFMAPNPLVDPLTQFLATDHDFQSSDHWSLALSAPSVRESPSDGRRWHRRDETINGQDLPRIYV